MAEGSLVFREFKFPKAIGPLSWLGGKRISRFWRAHIATLSGEAGVINTTQDGACTLEWPADAQVVKLSHSILIPQIGEGSPLTLHLKVESDKDVQWHRCIKSIELCAVRAGNEIEVIAEFSQPLIGMNGANSVYYVQCIVDSAHSGADAEIVLWFMPRATQVSLRRVAIGFTKESESVNLIYEKPDDEKRAEPFAPSGAVAESESVPDWSVQTTPRQGSSVPYVEAGFGALVDDVFATHASYVRKLVETSITAIVAYYTAPSANKLEADGPFNQGIASLVRLNEQNIADFSMEIHALRTKIASLQKALDEYTGRR